MWPRPSARAMMPAAWRNWKRELLRLELQPAPLLVLLLGGGGRPGVSGPGHRSGQLPGPAGQGLRGRWAGPRCWGAPAGSGRRNCAGRSATWRLGWLPAPGARRQPGAGAGSRTRGSSTGWSGGVLLGAGAGLGPGGSGGRHRDVGRRWGCGYLAGPLAPGSGTLAPGLLDPPGGRPPGKRNWSAWRPRASRPGGPSWLRVDPGDSGWDPHAACTHRRRLPVRRPGFLRRRRRGPVEGFDLALLHADYGQLTEGRERQAFEPSPISTGWLRTAAW